MISEFGAGLFVVPSGLASPLLPGIGRFAGHGKTKMTQINVGLNIFGTLAL